VVETFTQPGQTPTPSGSSNIVHADKPQSSPSKHEGVRSALSTLGILLLAPVVAILLTAFVFQSYQVDGPSMETTLFNNDRLIVWKMPRTFARLTGHSYIPNRGDIIVFTDANIAQFGEDPSKQLIKRVIGLPGERVVVKNSVVTVYNTGHPKGFNPDFTLPYQRLAHDTSGDIDVTIKPGQVYVLGDNRPDSLDSRLFGPVDASGIIGKLVVRVLPINAAKRF